ncbi:Retinoblastoma-binding protein [Coemansia sp. RSA 2050]|nr:Retinoblastoma-binding protein [Coemansia sp. RSA 2050]KAJ2734130.1 Retinoblastoma-binding protein [Coemansia sp. BCRC 34962]
MSHIQYKFRSAKDYSTTIFDGLSISVIDLKQELLREQKLDPEEYNLVITNEQTGEDYVNDLTLIPKNTTVLVRRVPYTGPKMPRVVNGGSSQQRTTGYTAPPFASGAGVGGGSYQRGHGMQSGAPVNQYGYRGPQGGGVNSHKNNASDPGTEADAGSNDYSSGTVEDAGIAAMLAQSDEQWRHEQSIMEMQRPIYHGRPGGPRPRPYQMRPENQGPPPPHYICHRCGKPGHWIYSCPSIAQAGDGTGKPVAHRVKRTTGIPKSFLQKVDNIEDVGNALVTSDGTLVVATANEAAWNRAQKMSRNVIATDELIDSSVIPGSIKCNICHRIARDAVTTPCCKTVFCSACIERELLEPGDMHFTCPACLTKDIVPDQLETAGETRSKVDEFLREYSAKQLQAEEERERAARDAAAAAAAATGSGSSKDSGVGTPSRAPAVAAATATSTGIARPPMPTQPRPPPRQQNYGMLPGMLMGMGMNGYPGMGGMPMGMGQIPPFMPPGMMMPSGMMHPAGMMPPQLPGLTGGQWNNSSMAPPVGTMNGAPPTTDAKSQPPSNMQPIQPSARLPSRSRSKHRRSRTRSSSRGHRDHRSGRRRSPKPSHGARPWSRLSSIDNRDDEKREVNGGGDKEYEAPPMDIDMARHVRDDRRWPRDDSRTRGESLARRDRRHERSSTSNSRHGGRYRSHEREPERERGRDGASHREGKEGASHSGHGRDGRSRSPTYTRTTRDGGRRSGDSGEPDSGVIHLSIRGQSAAAAATIDRPESGKARNILDRIRDDRPMSHGSIGYGGALKSSDRGSDGGNSRRRGGSGRRR